MIAIGKKDFKTHDFPLAEFHIERTISARSKPEQNDPFV